jgi:hypothetical protein
MRDMIPELRALRSPDASQRERAALALNAVLARIGGYGGPGAAARRRRDRRIVVALVGALVDDSAAVRAASGWALSTGKTGRARGQPRGEVVRELRALLRDRRADTRLWAARVLGRWRDQASLPTLRRLAVRDPRPAVRAAAQVAVARVRRAWIIRKATARDQTGHGAVIISMAMSPDGRTIFTAGWDGTVRAWDVRAGRVTWVCAREDYRGEWSFIEGIALAPCNRADQRSRRHRALGCTGDAYRRLLIARSEQLEAVAREDGARVGFRASGVRRADVGHKRLEDTGRGADRQQAAGLRRRARETVRSAARNDQYLPLPERAALTCDLEVETAFEDDERLLPGRVSMKGDAGARLLQRLEHAVRAFAFALRSLEGELERAQLVGLAFHRAKVSEAVGVAHGPNLGERQP